MSDAGSRCPGRLNEPQQRRLMVTCKYIDGLLDEIEAALESATGHSPFPRYVVDVTPTQARHIESEIARLRNELLRFLSWQDLAPQPADIPVTRSVLTDLSFVDNAVEELKPRYMRGCGPVPEDALEPLNQSIHGLQSMVRELQSYIRHEVRGEPKAT